MDQKILDAKLKAVGVSDDALRAIIVENLDPNQNEEQLDRFLSTDVGVAELVSLAKCYTVPGFKKVVDEIGVIGSVLARM